MSNNTKGSPCKYCEEGLSWTGLEVLRPSGGQTFSWSNPQSSGNSKKLKLNPKSLKNPNISWISEKFSNQKL